jgi:hypothetical protein
LCFREEGLEYTSMMVVTMNLPSGTSLANIEETKLANKGIPRVEQPNPDTVHFYMNEVRQWSGHTIHTRKAQSRTAT